MLNAGNQQLQQHGTDIENSLKYLSGPLGGILKYVGNACESFFGNTQEIGQADIDLFHQKLEASLLELEQIENQILSLTEADAGFVNFYLNNLNLSRKKIALFQKAAYIEAQKSGYHLSEEETKKLLQEINELQDEIYGPEISSNPKEVTEILSSFATLYNQNKDILSEDEKIKWQELIGKKPEKEHKKTNNIEQNISLEEKLKIVQTALNIYGLFDWKIVIEQSNGSIRINGEKKEFIFPQARTEGLSTKKLLQLLDHEIGVHVIRTHNSTQTINRKLEGYLESEEGFASLSELLFDQNINEVSYNSTDHHHKTFLAEIFGGDEYKEYLRIYLKLANPSADEEKIQVLFDIAFQRSKRFVSYEFPGANRKDVSYSRGLSDIITYLQKTENQDGFIQTFYQAKSSLKNMDEAAEVAKLFPEAKLKYPLWIGKIIYKKLLGEKIFLESLQNEDFRFMEIKKLKLESKGEKETKEHAFATKRKIVEIFQIIRGKKS